MAKMQIIFDGFKDLAEMIDKAGGDLKAAAEDALNETQNIVQSNLTTAAAVYSARGRKGYATGGMYNSIRHDYPVEWRGSVAQVSVGFDLSTKDGFHSIFIMYGTPRIKKDTKVYNAIRGVRTRKEIEEKQRKIMELHLAFGGKG